MGVSRDPDVRFGKAALMIGEFLGFWLIIAAIIGIALRNG